MTTAKKLPSGIALSCLFAALCCVGALVSIPIGPVPLTLSNFFAVLGGLLLGPWWGTLATALYILLGAMGFPVFSGGKGGLAHLASPLAGYLAGYLIGALLAGAIARRRGSLGSALGSSLGFAIILVLGACGLALISGLTIGKAFTLGALPFLPGDAAKAVLAAIIAAKLGPFVDSLIGPRSSNA